MKCIVAGGRDFNDAVRLFLALDNIFSRAKPREIVSGRCPPRKEGPCGADYLGECYAKQRGIPVKGFPAAWDAYGLAAGPIRNEHMAKYATHAVVFWDGKSRGSKNMIDLAMKYGLELRIVRY